MQSSALPLHFLQGGSKTFCALCRRLKCDKKIDCCSPGTNAGHIIPTIPQEEYALLCEENGMGHEGFDLHNFVEFVNDTSGTGCRCENAELQIIHRKLCTLQARTHKAGGSRERSRHRSRPPASVHTEAAFVMWHGEGSKQPGSLFKVFPCIASPPVWFFLCSVVHVDVRRHHKSVGGFWDDTFLPTAPLRASRSGPREPPAKAHKELESRGREKTDDSGGREAVFRELFSVLDGDGPGRVAFFRGTVGLRRW